MDKKLIRNFIYNSAYQVMIIFIPFITIPYISRIFSPVEMGIFGSTSSVSSLFCTISIFALNYYGVREIAKVKDNSEKLSIKYREIRAVQLLAASFSSLIYIIFFIILNKSNLKIAFIVQFLGLMASFFDISWLFMGLELFNKTFFRNTLAKLISIISIFIFVKDAKDLYIYIAIIPISTFVGNLSMWSYKSKIIKKVKLNRLNLINNFKGAFLLFIPTIFTNIYLVLDRSILNIVSNFAEVGMYDQSQKIIRIMVGIVTSLSMVMLPRISNMLSNNSEQEDINKLLSKSFNLTLFISVGAGVGIFTISDNFVPWFYSMEYFDVIYLIKISSLVCIFTALGSFFSNQCAIPINNKKAYIIPLGVAAILSVILNLILGSLFGAKGSAITIVIVEAIALILRIFYLRRSFDIKNLFSKVYIFIVSGLGMFLSIRFCQVAFNLSPKITSTFIEVFVGSMGYILILMILEKDYRNLIFSILKRKKVFV